MTQTDRAVVAPRWAPLTEAHAEGPEGRFRLGLWPEPGGWVGHGGAAGGYRAELSVYPGRGIGATVLANRRVGGGGVRARPRRIVRGWPAMSERVLVETSKGAFTLELNADAAPKSVANFLSYVDAEHYDGAIFHRVIPGFMIQGGGYDADYRKKPVNDPVPNEADNGLKNLRGAVSMARTSDPHSATAQFFVNTVDNDFLDHTAKTDRGWGYAVFGRVVDGVDTVDAIKGVPTGAAGPFSKDAPREPVVIRGVRRA